MAISPPTPCTCTTPPVCECIVATPYADWKRSFPDTTPDADKLYVGLGAGDCTLTTLVNYTKGNLDRHAFGQRLLEIKPDGKRSVEGRYHFHISFTDGDPGTSEIVEFLATYAGWKSSRARGTHLLDSSEPAGVVPPVCGTPYTPKCPPDPLLEGTMRYLRDLRAGPGARPAELEDAGREVERRLRKVIGDTIAAHGVTDPAVPSDLQGAIRYLRALDYQRALGAGSEPGSLTLERAGLAIEALLLGALEAELRRLPLP